MKTVLAILLAPFVLVCLIVLAIGSIPMMMIGLSFLILGDEDRYIWWNEHSPMIYILDRV